MWRETTYGEKIVHLANQVSEGNFAVKTIKVEYLKFDAEQMRKEGIPLLELAQKAVSLYEKQEMKEKRRILDFVFSNSSWKAGRLAPTTENRMTHSHLRTLGQKKKSHASKETWPF